jgi:hypothetical protein
VLRNTLILILLIGGMAAIGLSFLLPVVLTPENTWSTSSAEDLQKTAQRMQKLAVELGGATSAAEKKRITKELEELQAAMDNLQGSLEGTINFPYWMSIVVLVVGIGLVSGGWWTYYFVPMPKEKPKTLAELDPDGTLEGKEVTALDYTKAVRSSRGKH